MFFCKLYDPENSHDIKSEKQFDKFMKFVKMLHETRKNIQKVTTEGIQISDTSIRQFSAGN